MAKQRIAKGFYLDLEAALGACIEEGYNIRDDRQLIKSMMWANLLHYPITDSLLDSFLDWNLEPFENRW